MTEELFTKEEFEILIHHIAYGESPAAVAWLTRHVQTEKAHFAMLGYMPFSIVNMLKVSGNMARYTTDAPSGRRSDMVWVLAGMLIEDFDKYGVSRETAEVASGIMALGPQTTRNVIEALITILNEEMVELVESGKATTLLDAMETVENAAKKG